MKMPLPGWPLKTQKLRERWKRAIWTPINYQITLRHYYSFDQLASQLKNSELRSSESWNILREAHPNFVIHEERDAWLTSIQQTSGKDGQDPFMQNRAADIVKQLLERGITDVHSVGVGNAPLEYYIKSLAPFIRLTVSDFSATTVARLQKVFRECDNVSYFDILNGRWDEIQRDAVASVVLMYRIDPELTNRQWSLVFSRAAETGVQNILYIPAKFLNLYRIFDMGMRRIKARVEGKQMSFTGYDRGRGVFQDFWRDLYKCETIRLGGMESYWLTRLDN